MSLKQNQVRYDFWSPTGLNTPTTPTPSQPHPVCIICILYFDTEWVGGELNWREGLRATVHSRKYLHDWQYLQSMNTCRKVLLQVNFFTWRHFSMPSTSLIYLRLSCSPQYTEVRCRRVRIRVRILMLFIPNSEYHYWWEVNQREGKRGNSSQRWIENTNMTDCISSL